jgi:hypothetical protein
MRNIPRLDWRYHTDAELVEMTHKLLGFRKMSLDRIQKDNCELLLEMVCAEQVARRIRQLEEAQ